MLFLCKWEYTIRKITKQKNKTKKKNKNKTKKKTNKKTKQTRILSKQTTTKTPTTIEPST